MLGATTSTGKLADDMYDLGHKDYYSEAQGTYIPISHMDFQHMVRAFVKQNDEDVRVDTQEGKVKDMVSKKAYQVMWDNCEKLKKDLKKTDDIVENNDKIYKKNLQKQEENLLYLTSKIERMKTIIEEKEESAEYWKNTYYNSQPKGCGYVFSEIPNDTDGQEFVDKMKKFFNKKTYKMRVRGQHIKPELRGTGATYWGQNLDESTHMRIYIEPKKGD
jgi:hypothetical protein